MTMGSVGVSKPRKAKDTMNAFGKSLNSIILKEGELLSNLDCLNNLIYNQFSNLEFPEVSLGNIVSFKNGLNLE